MPTNRRQLGHQRLLQVTGRMRALYQQSREIERNGENAREPSIELHRLLGRRPWELNVLDVTRKKPPDDCSESEAAEWAEAYAIKRELEAV